MTLPQCLHYTCLLSANVFICQEHCDVKAKVKVLTAPFVDPTYDPPQVLLPVDFVSNLKLPLTNKCLYTCQTNTQQRQAGASTPALQLACLAQ